MAVAPRSARCRDPEAPSVSYEQVPDEYTTLANLDWARITKQTVQQFERKNRMALFQWFLSLISRFRLPKRDPLHRAREHSSTTSANENKNIYPLF